jgi:hypothetical protein
MADRYEFEEYDALLAARDATIADLKVKMREAVAGAYSRCAEYIRKADGAKLRAALFESWARAALTAVPASEPKETK